MLGKLLGGDLVKNVGGIIDSLHTSEEEKAQAKIKLKEIEAQINKAQSDINLADAKSVAGGLSGMLQRLATFNWNVMCFSYILGICIKTISYVCYSYI